MRNFCVYLHLHYLSVPVWSLFLQKRFYMLYLYFLLLFNFPYIFPHQDFLFLFWENRQQYFKLYMENGERGVLAGFSTGRNWGWIDSNWTVFYRWKRLRRPSFDVPEVQWFTQNSSNWTTSEVRKLEIHCTNR